MRLYQGGAHLALGYSAWGDYFEAEFGGDRASAYRLLKAAQVVETLSLQLETEQLPANEAQARELAPLLREPEKLQRVWQEVIELFRRLVPVRGGVYGRRVMAWLVIAAIVAVR